MNAAVEAAGGSLNGITARDHGCYYTPIHPDQVGTGLAVLGDLIRRPLLRELDVEREVILEEILDEVDASGRDIDPDNLSKRIVFGDHPLGLKIAGTSRSVRRLARRDVRAHHGRYLHRRPTWCWRWPARWTPPRWPSWPTRTWARSPAAAPAWTWRRRPGPTGRGWRWWSTTTPRPSSRSPSPARPSTTPTTRPTSASGGSWTTASPPACPSRWWRSAAWPTPSTPGIDTFADAGMTVVDGACAPAQAPARRRGGAAGAGRSWRTQPVSEEELLRVQRRHRMTLAFSLDSVADLAGWYGAGEVLSSPEGFEERCRRVEAVTPADAAAGGAARPSGAGTWWRWWWGRRGSASGPRWTGWCHRSAVLPD